ncbi:hypothetical protein DFH09DRAFT_1091235 [Mycena vulgaris]|nr:hypothetical protein DFH09DRAFT_1091235 [Mycena vulgaris]
MAGASVFQTMNVTPTRKSRREKKKCTHRARLRPAIPSLVPAFDEPDWDMATREDDGTLSDTAQDSVIVMDGPAHIENADTAVDLDYEDYTEMILQEGGSFYQISADLFIVSGWDGRTRKAKTSWYHLQRTIIGADLVIVCRCPLSSPDGRCVHEKFLLEYGAEMFPVDEVFSSDEPSHTSTLLCIKMLWIIRWSINGRTVVIYDGDDAGSGDWSCRKDPGTRTCYHINQCRDMLQKLVLKDPSAQDSGVGDGCRIDYAVPATRRGTQDSKAVSYLPISAPIWAALPTDPVLYQRQVLPNRQQIFKVYGLGGYVETVIEVQACSRCSHRLIGPGARELGIFNYNNHKLFTHDLLDEYTSAYTSSETPFVAWVTVVARRYDSHSGGAQKFISDEMFWAHLLPTLEPPTTSHPASVERQHTRYLSGQQLIVDRCLWKLVLKVITGSPLSIGDSIAGAAPVNEGDEEDDEEEEEDPPTGPGAGKRSRTQRARDRARKGMLERLEAIPLVVSGLARIEKDLGELFDQPFGEICVVRGTVAPSAYRRLFVQICAEESVLQMTTALALDCLEQFVLQPSHANGSALVEIPAIHEVLSYERLSGGDISPTLISVCRWVLNRGRMILNSLVKGAEPPRIAEGSGERSWTEVAVTASQKSDSGQNIPS